MYYIIQAKHNGSGANFQNCFAGLLIWGLYMFVLGKNLPPLHKSLGLQEDKQEITKIAPLKQNV